MGNECSLLSFNLLAGHVHANDCVRRPGVRTSKREHHRFTVHFTRGQFRGPAVVIGEIRRVRKLPGEPIGNTQPGVGANQFAHSVPVVSIKSTNIKLDSSYPLWTGTSR